MELNFCRRCGAPLTKKNGHVYTCERGHTIFLNPVPTVGVFLFDTSDNLLLSVRAIEPDKGALDAFGGFVDGDETFEQALERELHEELGLTSSDYSKPVYLTSAVNQYRYGGEPITVISNLYYARLKPSAQPKARDDVAEIHKITLNDVRLDMIGGDDIRRGLLVLKELFAPEAKSQV